MLRGVIKALRRLEFRGVSLLLELMLGFSLVTIALLAVFRIFPTTERAAVLADRTAQAHHLASSLLQAQLDRPYSALSVGVLQDQESIQHTQRRGVKMSTNFHCKTEITRPYSGRDIYNIVVSVTWVEGSSLIPRPSAVRLEAEKGRLW